MNTFIINIMNKYGYFGILLLITIENIFHAQKISRYERRTHYAPNDTS